MEPEVRCQMTERSTGLIFAFGVIIGVIVGIVIAYQMLSEDVADHIREYATFKAMGFRQGFFVGIILEEAIILAAIGFWPGLAFSALFYQSLAYLANIPIFMTPERAAAVFIGTIIACSISGVLAMRKLSAAEPLAHKGARIAGTPKTAATGAEIVFSMVYGDAASRAVWMDAESGALAGMAKGALGVEMSTLSPDHVAALHAAAKAQNVAFLDAPLAGSRPQAEAGQLIFMAGGAAADVARAEPVLLAMGAAVHHAGGPGAGSVFKLMVNTLFGAQLATIAELLGMAAKSGLDPARALEVVGSTTVASPAVKMAGGAMLARNFVPAAPIDLISKDLSLAAGMGNNLGPDMPMAQDSGEVYRAASAEGFGADNITGVVQRYIPPTKIAAE